MKKLLLLSALLLCTSILLSQEEEPYNGPLIPYKKGENWGFSDMEGNIIIAPDYDEVMFFTKRHMHKRYRYAKVNKNGKWGIINDTGEVVLSPEYDSIRFTDIHHYVIVGDNDRFGGYSLKSRKSFPANYDRLEQIRYSYRDISNRYLYAVNGDRAGIVSIYGDEVIPFEYDSILLSQYFPDFSDEPKNDTHNKFIGKIGNELYIHRDGDKKERFTSTKKFSFEDDGNTMLWDEESEKESEKIENGHLAQIKEKLRVNILKEINSHGFYLTEKNGLYGLIQKNTIFKRTNGRSYRVDTARVVLSPEFDTIYEVKDYFSTTEKPWFVSDQKYKELILVVKDGKSYIITDKGELVYHYQDGKLIKFISDLVLITRNGDKWGYIDIFDREKSVDNQYDYLNYDYEREGMPFRVFIYHTHLALFRVKKGNLSGFLGSNGVEFFEDE